MNYLSKLWNFIKEEYKGLLVIIIVLAIAILYSWQQVYGSPTQPVSGISYGFPISIWNRPATIAAGHVLIAGLPDTFDNHIVFNSNQSIIVAVMSIQQYRTGFHNTSNFVFDQLYRGKHIDFWFNASAGCADYMYVVFATNPKAVAFIEPNTTAIYNPGKNLTGVCA